MDEYNLGRLKGFIKIMFIYVTLISIRLKKYK